MLVENLDLNVSCKIDQFRYFSKINGLSLLDGTYLERLISYFFKGQNLISSKIVVELKDLKIVLEVDTTEGIKGIFIRLSNVGALSFAKIGKYHKQKYTIIGVQLKLGAKNTISGLLNAFSIDFTGVR